MACWMGRTVREDRIRIRQPEEKFVGMIKKRDPALVGVSLFVFGPEEFGLDVGLLVKSKTYFSGTVNVYFQLYICYVEVSKSKSFY